MPINHLTNYPINQLTPPKGPWLRPEASEVSHSAIAVRRTFTRYHEIPETKMTKLCKTKPIYWILK
jgi:hypothetical protein